HTIFSRDWSSDVCSSDLNTYAARKLEDDIPEAIKKHRLDEIIQLQRQHSESRLSRHIGKEQIVLVEGHSRRSQDDLFGRNEQNSVVVFPKEDDKAGDFVRVKINKTAGATLLGKAIEKVR